MKDFLDTLFEDTSNIGVVPENDFHNHVINEAIILDKVNNDKKVFSEVIAEVGKYAVRDNLLETTECINSAIAEFKLDSCPKTTAVLAIAKEASDPDYESFCKAYTLMKTLMETLKNKYGAAADERVLSATKEIESNPRIMNTIEKFTGESCNR